MAAIAPADGVDAAASTAEQFVELLCADEDLLRAEFDAIIAAEWPEPPPTEPDGGLAPARRPREAGRRARARAARAPSRARQLVIGGMIRERSPPTAATTDGHSRQPQPTATTDSRKGR